MKSLKKFSGIILLASTVFCMTACPGPGDDSDNGGGNGGGINISPTPGIWTVNLSQFFDNNGFESGVRSSEIYELGMERSLAPTESTFEISIDSSGKIAGMPFLKLGWQSAIDNNTYQLFYTISFELSGQLSSTSMQGTLVQSSNFQCYTTGTGTIAGNFTSNTSASGNLKASTRAEALSCSTFDTGYQNATWTATYTRPGGPLIRGSWQPTSLMNAPSKRWYHTAIWTGSEMVIWGGSNYDGDEENTGGRYNPVTDSWTPTSTVNAPEGREWHTSVWTGNVMIVWGGFHEPYIYVNTGGIYSPSTNSWSATATGNAPSKRIYHSAVWTGTEMIIWGGYIYDGSPNPLNTGGRYNPVSNTWVSTQTTNAPSARDSHTAVWTGTEMIVWGGFDNDNDTYFNSGGKYTPSSNSWTSTSTVGAPEARNSHSAVWTGTEMIVWGGHAGWTYFDNGASYNPNTNSWTAISAKNSPDERKGHNAVWTGSEMILWGGVRSYRDGADYKRNGGIYNPSTNTWTFASTINAPNPRTDCTAVWTGTSMIIWGGWEQSEGRGHTNTGGRYQP